MHLAFKRMLYTMMVQRIGQSGRKIT